MIIQRILRGQRVAAMRQKVKDDPGALDLYASASSFPGLADEDLLNTTISLPDAPPILVVPAGGAQDVASHDADNAILVYNYLGALNRTQAADTRLWATLAHTTFWDYVRARWGEDDRDKLRTAVLRHWFVPEGASKAALRTHAVSRLWWAAHLTCAPWERDPELGVFKSADRFRFTRILLRRQQIYFDLVERDYGSDLRLRICVLDALDRHAPSVSWKDALSREASKRLNLLVKHRQIGSLDLDSLRRTCDRLIGDVATGIAGGVASPPPAAPAAATA
jgi:hypothetical protein